MNAKQSETRQDAEVIEMSLLQAVRRAIIEGELQNCKNREEEKETILAYLLHCEMENQIRFDKAKQN